MKFLFKAKDGGNESTVTGYWLLESKKLFSICLLKFEGKSREAFHTHAFNCISIILKGNLIETMLTGESTNLPKYIPFITRKTDFHKVDSIGNTWLISFRGPWDNTWKEYIPKTDSILTLTHGRSLL